MAAAGHAIATADADTRSAVASMVPFIGKLARRA